jgi:hypothetical protein
MNPKNYTRLLCPKEAVGSLVDALWTDDAAGAVLLRTGNGWAVEFVPPSTGCPAVQALLDAGVVRKG